MIIQDELNTDLAIAKRFKPKNIFQDIVHTALISSVIGAGVYSIGMGYGIISGYNYAGTLDDTFKLIGHHLINPDNKSFTSNLLNSTHKYSGLSSITAMTGFATYSIGKLSNKYIKPALTAIKNYYSGIGIKSKIFKSNLDDLFKLADSISEKPLDEKTLILFDKSGYTKIMTKQQYENFIQNDEKFRTSQDNLIIGDFNDEKITLVHFERGKVHNSKGPAVKVLKKVDEGKYNLEKVSYIIDGLKISENDFKNRFGFAEKMCSQEKDSSLFKSIN
jgi:hypothetical protein